MSKQIINNGESGLTIRTKLNQNFTELYNLKKFFVDPVNDYGAVGDGVNDDTSAIQAAINSGLPVQIPPGIFKITSTIILGQADFIGSGADNTIFDIHSCDGFQVPLIASNMVYWLHVVEPNTSRKETQISNFSIYSLASNCQNHNAIIFEKDIDNTNVRASGFKFSYLTIGKQGIQQFGAAFQISDSFRVSLNDVGITNCRSGVLVIGQVVECSLRSVWSNMDESFASTVFDTGSYGLYVGGSNHTGIYQIPESFEASHCGFVSHDIGLWNDGSLHARYDSLDLDYCVSIGLKVDATNGFTFSNSYIGIKGISTSPSTPSYGMKFGTTPFSQIRNVNIEKNYITSISGASNANKIAIYFSQDFRRGGNIIANEIISGDNSSARWQYGIYMSRSKRFIVSRNVILDGAVTDTAIYLNSVEDFTLTDNLCDGSSINYSIGAGKFWVSGNIYSAITESIVGSSKGLTFQTDPALGSIQFNGTRIVYGLIETSVDFNTLTETGEYINTSDTNNPNAGYGFYFVSVRRSVGYQGTGFINQVAYPPFTTDTPIRWYTRASQNGGSTWSAWRSITVV